MTGEKDFQRRLEVIERGIRELEAAPDAGMRATTQQLVQSIVELHGRSLARLLEIIDAAGVAGPAIIEQLGRDPLVSPLLLLHSLHPLPLEARVRRAIESVEPSVRSQGGGVDLIGIVDGVVRLRVLGGPGHKAAVQQAIVDAAPDMAALEIDGADETVVGFVSIESVRNADATRAAAPRAQPSLALTRGA